MRHFDFVVLGGGSAGYAAARTAVAEGLRTAVIDSADELGGLCILRGCMPSKALIASANVQRMAGRGGEFGLRIQTGPPDMVGVLERKRSLVREFAEYRQGQLEDGRFELIRGAGVFLDSRRISIALRGGGSREVEFERCLIATGSVPRLPPIPGLEEVPYWTSDNVVDSAELPSSILILGGGAVALEFAHYYQALGAQVSLVQRGRRLLSGLDEEIGLAVADAFVERGMKVYTGTTDWRLKTGKDGVCLEFLRDGEFCSVEAARLLVATGRVPNTRGLGLDLAGVNLDPASGRVVIDAHRRTSAGSIYAAGDVCGPDEIVHVAVAQGEVAALNAAIEIGGGACSTLKKADLIRLFGVFCEPQVGVVGLGEEEANRLGMKVRSASYPFNDHGKSLVLGETHGFVKLIAEEHSGRVLGGACVGPVATELVHEIAAVIHFGGTVEDLLKMPHYHPTLSEIWTYPAEELVPEK